MSSSPFPAAVQKRRQDQHQSLQEDSLLRPKNTAWLDLKEKPKYHKVTTRAAYGGPVCYPQKKRGEDGPSPFSPSQSFAFFLRNTWRSRLRLVISNNFPSVFVDKPHTRGPWAITPPSRHGVGVFAASPSPRISRMTRMETNGGMRTQDCRGRRQTPAT